MADGPSQHELDRLYDTMRDGFTGIHHRLDTLNGRTLANEIGRENLRVKLDALRVDFHELEQTFSHARELQVVDPPSKTAEAGAFTKREYALMGIGFSALMLLLKGLELLGGVVWASITTGVHK